MSDKRPYVIQQGDYLAKLAFRLGFDANAVWNAPENRALRDLRPSSDLLQPGDILQVPPPSPAGPSLTSGTSNEYAAEVPTVDVALLMQDPEGTILKDEPCEIAGLAAGAGGSPTPETTDGEGVLALKVPVTLREIEVHLPRLNVTLHVLVGDMDPENERSGVQKRLQNMGYGYFDPDVDPDEALAGAVRAFQASNGLEPSGQVDDATRKAIRESYGL